MTRSKTLRRLAAAVTAVALLVAATATSATAQQKQRRGVTNIVLVTGETCDGRRATASAEQWSVDHRGRSRSPRGKAGCCRRIRVCR